MLCKSLYCQDSAEFIRLCFVPAWFLDQPSVKYKAGRAASCSLCNPPRSGQKLLTFRKRQTKKQQLIECLAWYLLAGNKYKQTSTQPPHTHTHTLTRACEYHTDTLEEQWMGLKYLHKFSPIKASCALCWLSDTLSLSLAHGRMNKTLRFVLNGAD